MRHAIVSLKLTFALSVFSLKGYHLGLRLRRLSPLSYNSHVTIWLLLLNSALIECVRVNEGIASPLLNSHKVKISDDSS